MDLTYERKNAYKNADEKKLKKIFEYSERYKRFLDNGKTEREVVAETVALAKENGYTEFDFSKDVKASFICSPIGLELSTSLITLVGTSVIIP